MTNKRENQLLNEEYSITDILNDCSIDRVMAIDTNWNIVSWNRTSEVISGLSKKKVLGKNVLEVFPQILEDQEILDAINLAFKGKKSFLPSLTNGFNRHYSENHFIPLHDKHGVVIGVMNIIHDVAHRIKVEKQLQKLNHALEKKYQQLEKATNELATFTYITSRDIKEPLKHVYTSLELLIKKDGHMLSNMSKGNLRRMQGSLNKMNLLLDDVTAISSITTKAEQLAQVNLNEVLDHATDLLKVKIHEKRAVIEAGPLPAITGYQNMLQYLFVHLIDNALKFQPDDAIPRIIIGTTLISAASDERQNLVPGQQYLNLWFRDNGIGFDPTDSERIFKPFEKLSERQYHGSGVGLTICKKIVEAHDGFIEGISSIGNGAVFNCYFPVDEEE